MSELSSLYARVHLTAPALRAFLESRPTRPAAYGDWRDWLDAASFYGTISDAAIATMSVGDKERVGAYVDTLCGLTDDGPATARYDADAQVWTLAVLQYAENYYDYLEILSVLRAIAAYKDLPGDDFILIYPYLWGGPPQVYLRIDRGASRLATLATDAAIAEADRCFQHMVDPWRAGSAPDAL